MAMNKRKPLEKITTPKGTFIFPCIDKPDQKYGKFGVRITAEASFAEPLIERLTKAAEAKMEAVREELTEKLKAASGPSKKKVQEAIDKLTLGNLPVREAYDEGADEPNGTYEVNFGAPATQKNFKTGVESPRVIKVFDSKGGEVSPVPTIWGGTEGRVSGFISPYYNPATHSVGVSLRLLAVQVIKLVSGGGGSASSHGFGVEEGGFTGDDLPKQDAPAPEAASEEAAADEF